MSPPTVDMMKLELDLHGLREETSAHVDRKDKEVVILQRRLQELQMQFTETQKLGLKKDTVRPGAILAEPPTGLACPQQNHQRGWREARSWPGEVGSAVLHPLGLPGEHQHLCCGAVGS